MLQRYGKNLMYAKAHYPFNTKKSTQSYKYTIKLTFYVKNRGNQNALQSLLLSG